MDENNPIKYSDLLQPDDSFEKLLDLLEQVGSRYSALQKSIKSSADAIKQSLSGVNVTTAQGQSVIESASKQVNELAKKEKQLAEVNSEVSKAIISKNAELKKAQRLAKLEQQLAESQEGSYNALSAQYNIIKERLNAMSAAQRENTKEGQDLTQQAAALYKQMKVLQEVTGKHTLSVGDYGVATVNLAADIRRAVQALTQMRLEGKAGTEQYNRLVNDLKRLKTQYSIVKTETQSLGSQTARLNQVMGALTSTSGALSAMTGLVNDSESDWAQSLLKVNKLIAITNGLMAFVNGLYKQSIVTNWLFNASKKAEVAARAMNIASIKAETKATWLQIAAQKALNTVAKANPIVLLGSLIVGVAAALTLFTSNTKKGKTQLEGFNKQLSSMRELLSALSGIQRMVPELKIESYKRAIDIYNELGNSEQQILEAEQAILKEREKMLESDMNTYSEYVDNLDANMDRESRLLLILKEWRKQIYENYTSKGKKPTATSIVGRHVPAIPEAGLVEGVEIKTEDVEDILNQALDNAHADVEIGLRIVTDSAELKKESKLLALKIWKQNEEIQKGIEEQDARLINERFDQRIALTRAQAEAEIRVLQHRLDTEVTLTEEQIAYLKGRITKITAEMNNSIAQTYYERRKANLSATRATEDLIAKAEKDGFEKRRKQIIQSYQRELEDTQNELKYNSSLTITEREELVKQEKAIELAKNKELSDLAHEHYKDVLGLIREYEDIMFDARAESYAKQLEQLETNTAREKEDLQDRLEFEELTQDQIIAIRGQIIAIDKRYARQRIEIQRALTKALLDNEKELWSNRLTTLNKYTQDYLDAAIEVNKAEKSIALADFDVSAENLGLSEEQRRKGRQAIIDRYNDTELETRKNHMQDLFDLDQELAESEFSIIRHSEHKKAEFTRKQEIARLRKILELDAEYGSKLTEQEKQIIRNRIAALENQPSEYSNFYDLLGIPAEWKDMLDDWVEQTLDAYQQIIDARMELAEAQVDAAQKEVDTTKAALDAELQARANGYANNVALARKEFEDAKKREKEALEFKRKVEKEQESIDTITQISSLVTATANFWSTSSKLGPIAGPIAASIATATMWAAFAIAKVRANQLKNEVAQYGKGTVEKLEGGSHASGHDISLGYTKDGRERRAEGGEYFAIINKKNSRKYGRTIEYVVNAFNTGRFEDVFTRRGELNAVKYVGLEKGNSQFAIQGMYSGIREFTREFGKTTGTDISRLETDVSALRKQMEYREYTEPDGTRVIVNGNNTRRIKHG